MGFDINISKMKLFGRTSAVEDHIDEFFDKIKEIGMVFRKAMHMYLEDGYGEKFEAFLKQGTTIENRADDLRRDIEKQLYIQTLIPDLRGDVLHLLEDMDNLTNIYEANLYRFAIQRPEIPSEYNKEFMELTEIAIKCVETTITCARAFFRDIDAVRDHHAEVVLHESEADRVGSRMQRAIFGSTLPLERKMHLRYFIERVDELANKAEDVADTLVIYALKRRI